MIDVGRRAFLEKPSFFHADVEGRIALSVGVRLASISIRQSVGKDTCRRAGHVLPFLITFSFCSSFVDTYKYISSGNSFSSAKEGGM